MDAARVDCPKVDAVVAHSFLHLLPGPKRHEVLRAWARVLRPGGRVLMSCALSEDESDWVRLKDLQEVDARRNTLEAAARNAGFEAEAEAVAETAARSWVHLARQVAGTHRGERAARLRRCRAGGGPLDAHALDGAAARWRDDRGKRRGASAQRSSHPPLSGRGAPSGSVRIEGFAPWHAAAARPDFFPGTEDPSWP